MLVKMVQLNGLLHQYHLVFMSTDPEKIRELARKVDVLTVEIEHVDATTLEQVQRAHEGKNFAVHPSPSTIQVIQDKLRQKQHLCPSLTFFKWIPQSLPFMQPLIRLDCP
jgi:phosphoribosylaminoimidazole carboxylase (NCAIR synthetase)